MKKKRLTFFGKLFFGLIFLCLLFLIFLIFSPKNIENINIINDYGSLNNITSDFIVNSSESDSDIIQDKFATGMNVNDFIELLSKIENYVDKSSKYKNIYYNFDDKLHYYELENIWHELNNSDIVKLEIIGKSVDNRNIYGIEVGNGDDVIFLDANLHAAEIANTLILTKFLSDLVNDYESGDEDVINALNDFKLAVIPSINPDGYEVYNFGVDCLNNKGLWWYENKDKYDFENMKSNANGIDINRNFPTQNAGLYYKDRDILNSVSFDKTTKSTVYFGGYSLGSEPETKAAMYFMLKHYKNTKKYINMHSQGRVIYAGKPNLPSEFNNLTRDFASDVSDINNYMIFGLSSEEVGQGNDGSASDFMAELACGFKFSSITGRLFSDKYENNSSKLIYSYPVITMETITTYTTNPSTFKSEYYDKNLKDVLYSLINL